MDARVEYVIETFHKDSIEISKEKAEKILLFFDLLEEWNKVMNLTAITSFEEAMQKHFVDSLMLYKVYQPEKGSKIIDIGTGAGFPGIPLKIMYPETRVVLVDSLNKRINFLNEVISKLALENVEALHARAEELARKEEYRETFDCCVSRAVANLTTLSEYCIPFVKKGGHFIAYKSIKAEEECKEAEGAIKKLGGVVNKVMKFSVAGDETIERTFVDIKKLRNTDMKYPRAGGKPQSNPLK